MRLMVRKNTAVTTTEKRFHVIHGMSKGVLLLDIIYANTIWRFANKACMIYDDNTTNAPIGNIQPILHKIHFIPLSSAVLHGEPSGTLQTT